MEQLHANVPRGWRAFFYRTSAGAEIDLVLVPGERRGVIAVEMKLSLAPTLTRGFWSAHEDLKPKKSYVIYPGTESYPLGKSVFALPVAQISRVWLD